MRALAALSLTSPAELVQLAAVEAVDCYLAARSDNERLDLACVVSDLLAAAGTAPVVEDSLILLAYDRCHALDDHILGLGVLELREPEGLVVLELGFGCLVHPLDPVAWMRTRFAYLTEQCPGVLSVQLLMTIRALDVLARG